jgi:HYR domain-containing protein
VLLDFTPDVIAVAGKGEIDSMITTSASCDGIPTGFVVTGGSGAYAGATGSGTFTPSPVANGAWNDNGDDSYPDDDDFDSWRSDAWKGTVTVPGLSFDLRPPVISGAVSKTVHVRTGKRARVTFAVAAADAVDGSVPARCAPRSGSFFRIGRTTVKCSATDSSANTATARFTVNVKRGRH